MKDIKITNDKQPSPPANQYVEDIIKRIKESERSNKRCPYREFKESGTYMSRGGTWESNNFMACLKDDCMAYDEETGKCKRLK